MTFAQTLIDARRDLHRREALGLCYEVTMIAAMVISAVPLILAMVALASVGIIIAALFTW